MYHSDGSVRDTREDEEEARELPLIQRSCAQTPAGDSSSSRSRVHGLTDECSRTRTLAVCLRQRDREAEKGGKERRTSAAALAR